MMPALLLKKRQIGESTPNTYVADHTLGSTLHLREPEAGTEAGVEGSIVEVLIRHSRGIEVIGARDKSPAVYED